MCVLNRFQCTTENQASAQPAGYLSPCHSPSATCLQRQIADHDPAPTNREGKQIQSQSDAYCRSGPQQCVRRLRTRSKWVSLFCWAVGLNSVSVVWKADVFVFALLMLFCSASLMLWSEDDGLEMSYPCGNNLSMGSIATDGTEFTIELAK